MTGYSKALDSELLFVYSPGKGINVWYRYEGQCLSCPKRDECRDLVLKEAQRLGVEVANDERMRPPAKLAEIAFRRVWPEVL